MKYLSNKSQTGLVSIALAVAFVLISSVIMAITSSSTMMGMKVINNNRYSDVAFDAAEAGLNYAMANLNENYMSYMSLSSVNNTLTGSLGNNTSYSINIRNISSGDNSLIQVTSTGTELNSNLSKTVSQLFQAKSLLINPPDVGAITKGSLDLMASSTITSDTENTVWSAGNFTAKQGSYTVTPTQNPASDSSGNGSDITENDSNLSNLSDDQFAENFFGTTVSNLKNVANISYSGSGNVNYSDQLSGQKGKIIYIEHSNGVITLDRGITVGTASEPVILIINGKFKMEGFTNFNGILYLNEKWVDKFKFGTINGALIVNGDVKFKQDAHLVYDSDIVNTATSGFGQYYRIAGTWKDF